VANAKPANQKQHESANPPENQPHFLRVKLPRSEVLAILLRRLWLANRWAHC